MNRVSVLQQFRSGVLAVILHWCSAVLYKHTLIPTDVGQHTAEKEDRLMEKCRDMLNTLFSP